MEVVDLPLSDPTINRLIRAMPDPIYNSQPRVIGIDDWAQRKAHTYGTIVVDLEHSQVIDLLADREAGTVQKWLEAHPTVEIVARDRADNYARGVTDSNPTITQVADRFHLIKNATDMLIRLFSQHPKLLPNCNQEAAVNEPRIYEVEPSAPKGPGDPDHQNPPTLAEQRFDQVKACQQQGLSQRATARELHIDRRKVGKYFAVAHYDQIRTRRRIHKIDPYPDYLRERWDAGETNRVLLHEELKAKGFKGSLQALYREMKHWPNT